VQDDSDSTCLTPSTVVLRSTRVVSSVSSETSTSPRPSVSAQSQDLLPTGDGPASCLATKYRGFSEEVVTRISALQCLSSLSIYQAKCRVFSAWCEQRLNDPLKIASFLVKFFKIKSLDPVL
jgi:hypothetical protein